MAKGRNWISFLNVVGLLVHLFGFIIIFATTWQKEGLPTWSLKRDHVGKQNVGEGYPTTGLSADNCPMDKGNIMTWGSTSLNIFSYPEPTNVRISLHVVILLFFLLSFLFQLGAEVYPSLKNNIYSRILTINDSENDSEKTLSVNWIRYLEYSISAYCVLLCVSLLAGITDICVLACISVLCHVCMILGLCAEWCLRCYWYTHTRRKDEVLSNVLKKCALILHVTGWVCIATPIIIILFYYRQWWDNGCESNSVQMKPPLFVIAIVTVEVILFVSFGIVQIFQFLFPDERVKTESAYIILSVFSKGFLATLISFNLFI